jgi:hypothetical protein
MIKANQKPALQDLSPCPTVEAILKKYGIGYWRNPGGTDKQKCEDVGTPADSHSYGPVYEALAKMVPKGSPIMEIGVFHGGSMLLWQDLFPESVIVGVDICNAVHSHVMERLDERATLIFDDAYDESFVHQLAAAGCSYGLIVDDGPHTLESQCNFLALYLALLKPGGIAVIEDIQETSWFEQLEAKIPNGYVSERIDRRQINGRWDDLMLVISKISDHD